GASIERMFNFVSIVGIAHEPSRAAAAAWRNCPVVRGNSTSARRGDFGNAVSACAISTRSDLRASMRSAKHVRNFAICSGGVARKMFAASKAAFKASSQSAQALMGNSSGSVSPVAGFSAWKVPLAFAAPHWPLIRMECVGMMFLKFDSFFAKGFDDSGNVFLAVSRGNGVLEFFQCRRGRQQLN